MADDDPVEIRGRILALVTFIAAVLCGAVPLLAGIAIYVTWRLTFWSDLEIAGIQTIGLGLVCQVIGGISLLASAFQAYRQQQFKKIRYRLLLTACLLISNFPVAIAILLSVSEVKSRFIVAVINESGQDVQRYVVVAPGEMKTLRTIRAGQWGRTYVHVGDDDCLTYRVSDTQATIKKLGPEGGDSCHHGKGVTIRLTPDGGSEVKEFFDADAERI